MIPRVFRLALALVVVTLALPAMAQSTDKTIEVVELRGVLDSRRVEFAISSIESAAASGAVEVVILEIDSPGVVADAARFRRLQTLVADPPLPLVTWVGPAPAKAFGGAAQLVASAPLATAAPGVEIGYWSPTIAGNPAAAQAPPAPDDRIASGVVQVDGPIAGVVDLVQPGAASPRQLSQLLDGMTIGDSTLSTVRPYTASDGSQGVTALETVFRRPGVVDLALGLATRPDAAFFLLVIGLTVAAFEFYAIGPGVAAGVAVVCLGLAAYGMAVLPVHWWAVALTAVAIWVLSVSYQRGGVPLFSLLGLAALTVAGYSFSAGGPQIGASVPGVVFTLVAAAFFFLLAMPVVARSRFSTQTIGRSSLVGRTGVAVGDLTPDGEVEVDGARWRATSHREAGIKAGDTVTVLAVDGWYLDVDRV